MVITLSSIRPCQSHIARNTLNKIKILLSNVVIVACYRGTKIYISMSKTKQNKEEISFFRDSNFSRLHEIKMMNYIRFQKSTLKLKQISG